MSSSHSRVAGAAFVVTCSLLSGCATQHVHLSEPPSKTAPYEERVAYYKEHRPVAVRTTPTGQTHGLLSPQELSYVVLEDGTRVDHVEDLLSTVEPGSPTATAAGREAMARDRSNLWSGASMGVVGLGTVVMMGSLIGIIFALPADPAAPVNDAAAFASLGALVGGSVIAMSSMLTLPMVVSTSTETMREKETAFLTYDRSLRERLDLVEYGQQQATALVEPPPDRLEDR